jgi:hypothetical protein
VELAVVTDGILMRNSKRPEDPPLCYTPKEIDAFFDGVKKGEFDQLVRNLVLDDDGATRSTTSPRKSVVHLMGARMPALIDLRPVTARGWMTALLSVVAILIVSLSLLTRVEVLHTPGGAVITLVALFVLTASRRLDVFKRRHLHG